jgi:hypothetical protein
LRIDHGPLVDREGIVGLVEIPFDLGLEKKDRSSRGEPENERDTEEARIEVPAPNGAVVEPPTLVQSCCDGYRRRTVSPFSEKWPSDSRVFRNVRSKGPPARGC